MKYMATRKGSSRRATREADAPTQESTGDSDVDASDGSVDIDGECAGGASDAASSEASDAEVFDDAVGDVATITRQNDSACSGGGKSISGIAEQLLPDADAQDTDRSGSRRHKDRRGTDDSLPSLRSLDSAQAAAVRDAKAQQHFAAQSEAPVQPMSRELRNEVLPPATSMTCCGQIYALRCPRADVGARGPGNQIA